MSEYDPIKAKEYYERTKQLKGREKGMAEVVGSGTSGPAAPPAKDRTAVRAAAAKRVKSLNVKLTQLKAALQAARAKAPSDKPTAGESELKKKQANEKYYNENKNEIANDKKAKARAAPATSGASTPAKPEARGVEELETAIRNTLTELKAAIAKLKTL